MSNPLSPAHLDLQAKLAKRTQTRLPNGAPEVFWAQVQNVNSDPASVDVMIGGSSTTIFALRYDATLAPTVGMTVWGLKVGRDYMVVGTVAA